MSQAIRAAVDELRQELGERVKVIKAMPEMAEIAKLQQTLNALESHLGEPATSLAQIFGLTGIEAGGASSDLSKPDEFYGLAPLEAAKRYLKKRGKARPFSEIVTAIKEGGCKVASEIDLRSSMVRSTYQIVQLPRDYFGLVEFYSHIKRARAKKGTSEARAEAEPASALSDEVAEESSEKEEGANNAHES